MFLTAFQNVVEEMLKAGCTGAKLATDQMDPNAETAKDGALFWERGHYVFYKEKNVVMEYGKYVEMYG